MRRALLAGLAVGAGLALAPAQATSPDVEQRLAGLEQRLAALEAAPPRCIKAAEAVAWERVRLGSRVVRLVADAPDANGRGVWWLAVIHRSCMRRAGR